METIELTPEEILVNLQENNKEDRIVVPANNAGNSHIINSFEVLNDKLDFTAYPGITVDEILANAFEDEDGAFVRLSGRFGSITLVGVSLAQLNAEIFLRVSRIAVDDPNVETSEEKPVNIDVLANDVDPEGRAIELIGFPELTDEGGTITRNEDGTPLYTPAAGFTGTDSFEYSISVGGQTQSATVTVTVNPNNGPDAIEDSVTTRQDAPPVDIDVLSNDFDLDGDNIVLTGFNRETDNGGTITRNEEDDTLIYTPAAGFLGTDSFRYRISDGQLTDTATVTVEVIEPENQPPLALDDTATATEGTPETIAVLENDSDPDGDDISIVGFPTTTTEGGTITLDRNGTFLETADDSRAYTSASGFTGTDSFTYTISDGELTDTATVIVTVEPVPNEAPIAADDAATATEGTSEVIAVLDNDFDMDGDPLSITGVPRRTELGARLNRDDDVLVYELAEVSETIADSFTYTISDGDLTDTATVTVTVEPDNQPPIAQDDAATTTEGIAVTIAVLDNDSDPDNDPLEITAVTGPANGTTIIDENGIPDAPTDDQILYTPDAGFNGTDDFSYSITDGRGGTASATVTVIVEANEAPSAVDDTATATEGTPATIAVLENDSDPDNPEELSITGVSETAVEGGMVSLNGETAIYTPPAVDDGVTVTDSFTYTISDGLLASSATVTVTVSENDPPMAVDDATTIVAETADNIIAVLSNDTDPDGNPLSITGITDIANGTVSIGGDRVIYTPDPGFVTVDDPDTFTYTITDGRGATDTATVMVTVTANLPPVATNDDVIVNQDRQTLTIPVLLNDSDPNAGDTITVKDISTPDNGGTVSINDNQQVEYTPSLTFTGDRAFTDSFVYTITDSQGETDAATVTITFEPELPGDDTLNGTDGDDLLIASDRDRLESQEINGGAGDDIIVSGVGPKILDGGEGADTFVYQSLETTTIAGDTIINFDPTMDKIVLDFEVSSGIQVAQDDVGIGTFGVPGFFTIGLNTANTGPDFLPESFVISLRSDLEQTTTEDILGSIEFGTV